MLKVCDMFTTDDGEELACTPVACATIGSGEEYTELAYKIGYKKINKMIRCGRKTIGNATMIFEAKKQ
ncbi:hypothetical protein K9L81_02445 [Candidatus Gracilibacteria bacterium]|nr:hypothetical protein [Candidatus Gracilibacteria bacterium]